MSDLHLLPNNEEGHAMIHQLQQRAEAWAEAVSAIPSLAYQSYLIATFTKGICNMVFSTDDYCKLLKPYLEHSDCSSNDTRSNPSAEQGAWMP